MCGSGVLMHAHPDRDRRKLLNYVRLSNDGRHGGMSQDHMLDALLSTYGLEQSSQRRNVGLKSRALLVQKQILGREHDRVRAPGDLDADVMQNLVKWNAIALPQCNRTELAPAPATARDLDAAERGAMMCTRDVLELWTGALYLPWQRLAAHCRLEQWQDQIFGLSVHETINEPFVLHSLVLDLPGARAAENHLQMWLMAA